MRRLNEKPAHRQATRQAYYLGKCEVTVGQFRRFVDATGYKTQAETDPVRKGGTKPDCGPAKGSYDTQLSSCASQDFHKRMIIRYAL